jgi:TRAP-type mannitol/chloroaromatic compound transport system substrate-binding protein
MLTRNRVLLMLLLPVTVLAVQYLPPGPAVLEAQRPITLKVQSSYQSGLVMYQQLEIFAERVHKLSAGRVRIETLPAGAVVGAFDVLDAAHRGVIDGAHTYGLYWVGKHKASMLFGGAPAGPFGMDSTDFVGWYLEGGGLELYQEFYRDVLKMNVVPITMAGGPPSPLGWFNRPVKSWEDFKGVKFRIIGPAADVFRRMGATVVTLPGGEIIPAAERGVIDAAEFLGGKDDMTLGFPQIWKHHYGRFHHEYTYNIDFLIHRRVWEKLAPDIQEILRSAGMEAAVRWTSRYITENARATKQMVDEMGVTVWMTPKDIMKRFLVEWDKIAEEEAAKDPFFRKVLESQRHYAALIVPYRLSLWPNYDFAAEHYWKGSVYAKSP